MKKIFISLFLFFWLFFWYSFAAQNEIIFQSDYSNFKNDYYNFFNSSISPNNSLIYAKASVAWSNPFIWQLSGWLNITWYLNSTNFCDSYSSGVYYWYYNSYYYYTSANDIYFNPTTLSIWYNNEDSSHDPCWLMSHSWFVWQDFPNLSDSSFSKVDMSMAWYNWIDPNMQSSYRVIAWYWVANPVYSYNGTFQPYYSTMLPALVQKFKRDEVIRYNSQWTWSSASMGVSNSQYFAWPWNAFSYVAPSLSSDWVGKWEDLYLWSVHLQDTFNWNWGVIPESYWILILTPNQKNTRSVNYKNTIIAISKDPQDPRNLLGWIYPNCNCTTLDCLANYCQPSKVGHLIWKIDTDPRASNHTCSLTGISTLLPYSAWTLWTYWNVNLNDVINYYWWQFFDDSYCNPIPSLFFRYQDQEPWWSQKKTFMPDVYLNWDYICFDWSYSTLNKNCVQIVSSTSVSPIAWASAQYSGMTLLWSYPETYYQYWSGTTNGYAMQVVAQLENTYWFTQQSCTSRPSTIYSWTVLRAYNSWRTAWRKALWNYCTIADQAMAWVSQYNTSTLDSGFLNSILYWSWLSTSTLFTCPANYQASTNLSMKISNFPWLSILNNTVLGDIDLIKSVACLIGAFNYWNNVWALHMPSLASTFHVSDQWSVNYLSWSISWATSSSFKAFFAQFFWILLCIPAFYLWFKMIL